MTDPDSGADEASVDVSSNEGEVRDRLSLIGEQIPVDSPSDELIGVEQAVQRRRRRRVLSGVIGAAVLVVGGVVAVNFASSDDTSSIQPSAEEAEESTEPVDEEAGGSDEASSEPAEDATDETVEEATEEPAESEPAADDAAVSAPAPTESAAAGDRSVVVAANAEQGVDVRLLPWADGFLRVQTTWPQPVFPSEIPEEITALFSDEVVELIQAEQPATVSEATRLLSEAGLMDEVTDVFNEHPEVNDVFFGGDVTEPTRTTDFSTDGVEWAPVELNLPPAGDAGQELQSNGTQLAVTQVNFGAAPEAAPLGGPPTIASITVFLTSDLVNWTEVAVPTPPAPADLPDFMSWSTWPEQLVMSETGWAMSLQVQTKPNIEMIFADELAEIDLFSMGYGLDLAPDGIVLSTYDEQGDETIRITRTWEELGVDPMEPEELWGGPGGAAIVSGTFDGSLNPSYDATGWGQLSGFSGGFLRIGEQSEFSTDGLTWTEIDPPAGEFFGPGVMIERDGTVVAFAGENYDQPARAHELDVEAGFWRPTDGPELPAGSQGNVFGPPAASLTGAAVYAVDEMFDVRPQPFEVTASEEIDGYTLTVTMTESGQSYSLVDAAGAVVVEESFDHETDFSNSPEGPYEFWRYGDFGAVTILDPATGDPLLDISSDVMDPLFDQLFRSMPEFEGPSTTPEQRLLATDGEQWIDESLVPAFDFDTEVGPPMEVWTNAVAMNGDIILIAFSDGSIERFTF